MKLTTTCTACNKQRKSKNLSYHPETLQPFCENPYECTEHHPNSIYQVAKRGTVEELWDYAKATTELNKRVTHFIESNELPFIAKFLNDNSGKALGTKLDTQTLTRLGRFIEFSKLQDNNSEAIRRLIQAGLSAFEVQHQLEGNLKVKSMPDLEELKPIPEEEPTPAPEAPEVPEPSVVKGTGVPVPVRKAEPEELKAPTGGAVEDEDEWVV